MLSLAALVSLSCILAVWGLYPALVGLAAAVMRRGEPRDAGAPARAAPRDGGRGDARRRERGARARGRSAAQRVSRLPARRGGRVRCAHDGADGDVERRRGSAGSSRARRRAGRQGGGAERRRARGARRRAGVRRQRTAIRPRMPWHCSSGRCCAPGVGAASGRLELAAGANAPSLPLRLYWSLERWLRRREADVHSAVGVTGAIYAMRRELWTPLPAGLILDDLYVPMRLVLRRPAHRVRGRGARLRDARDDGRQRVSPEGAHAHRRPAAVRLAPADADAAAQSGLGCSSCRTSCCACSRRTGCSCAWCGRSWRVGQRIGPAWLLAATVTFVARAAASLTAVPRASQRGGIEHSRSDRPPCAPRPTARADGGTCGTHDDARPERPRGAAASRVGRQRRRPERVALRRRRSPSS